MRAIQEARHLATLALPSLVASASPGLPAHQASTSARGSASPGHPMPAWSAASLASALSSLSILQPAARLSAM